MIEKIGDRSAFQIQCVHESFPGSDGHVFGRMCLRFEDDVLGDFDEPACMLDVSARYFEGALKNLAEHDDPELPALTDEQLWERLDSALYRDDNRTIEQIDADAERYRRFDFLTNGGEPFDNSKSFFLATAHEVRILFTNDEQPMLGVRVERSVFVETLQAWLQWLNSERARSEASKRALEREFEQLHSILHYSMHELPAGVLWNPNAATPAQCVTLMADLNRFAVVSEQLSIATQEFVEACRWHLDHYPHYLSRRRHFADYARYVLDRGGPLRVPLLDW